MFGPHNKERRRFAASEGAGRNAGPTQESRSRAIKGRE